MFEQDCKEWNVDGLYCRLPALPATTRITTIFVLYFLKYDCHRRNAGSRADEPQL